MWAWWDKIAALRWWGNSLQDYLWSLILFLLGVFLVWILGLLVEKWFLKKARQSVAKLDQVLAKSTQISFVPILYVGVFYAVVGSLNMKNWLRISLEKITLIFLFYYGIRFLVIWFSYFFENYWMHKYLDDAEKRSFQSILSLLKVLIWIIGIIFLLDNLGLEITSVLTGLGIGGVAVALASQALLEDLFSYFAILLDRPFEIGDTLEIENLRGEVEKVGVKTTCLRSVFGEQLIIPNKNLTDASLKNYKRMERRRVDFKLGVACDTSHVKLEKIPTFIKEIISSIELTEIDRVHWISFGDFTLDFEVYYYVLSSDYNLYCDIQQQINLAILKKFEEEGISLPYPTQSILLERQKN